MSYSSYPTPPPAGAAPAPASPAPEQPALSEPQRIIDVFIAPRKTFEDLKRNPSWWVPWLLGAIVTLAFGIAVTQKMDLVGLTRHQIEQSRFRQQQFEQLTPEQQEQQMRAGATATKVVFYALPVFTL